MSNVRLIHVLGIVMSKKEKLNRIEWYKSGKAVFDEPCSGHMRLEISELLRQKEEGIL